MATSLTNEAIQGYDREPASYIPTSPSWYAYHLGIHLYVTGRSMPTDVRMSRGCTIRSGDLLFKHVGTCDGLQQFERIR
jgi:hypothetical protein